MVSLVEGKVSQLEGLSPNHGTRRGTRQGRLNAGRRGEHCPMKLRNKINKINNITIRSQETNLDAIQQYPFKLLPALVAKHLIS